MEDAPSHPVSGRAEDARARAAPGDTSTRWTRTLINTVPDLVAVVDAEGTLLYANVAAARVLGYEPTAEVGRDMLEFVHPDDLDSVVASFRGTVASPGPSPPMTFRMRSGGGDWRYLETTATNCLADPSVAGVVVNARDVTDRVQAEVRADRLTRMYRMVVQANEAMARSADTESMLKRACDIVVTEGGFRLAWVGLVVGDLVVPTAIAGEPVEYVESLEVSLSSAHRGPTASAILGGHPERVTDVSDEAIAPWRERFMAAGFASSCAAPIPPARVGDRGDERVLVGTRVLR